jgi:hypothetical protein
MVAVELESGRTIRMSERHPTASGRAFVSLSPGDLLGESKITGIRSVAYEGDATFDILPDSDTGVYFAEGAPVGSTLKAGFSGALVPQ